MAHKTNKGFLTKTKKKIKGGDWWEPEKNVKNYFRICPAWDEQGISIFRRVLHYGLEMDERSRAFPCLEDNEPWLDSVPCPSCHVSQKMKEGNEDERAAGKELASGSPRFVCQGVHVNQPERGIVKYAGPISFGKYVISLLEDDDLDDITDPDDGYDLIIEVSGKGRGTKYDYRIRPKSTKIAYPEWEDHLSNLIGDIEVLPSDEMIEVLKETFSSFDVEEYLEDFKTGGKVKKTKKKSKVKKIEWDDLKKMKQKELLALVEDYDLDVKDEDWEDIKELREIVSEELEEGIPF